MFLPSSHGQVRHAPLYDASGTITSGGTAQLVLPRQMSRSSLIFINNSANNMLIEFGPARAGLPVLSSGTVASVPMSGTNSNVGFGYSRPPKVIFYGGAFSGQPGGVTPTYSLISTAEMTAPNSPAQAHCVMTGAAGSQTVSSIVIDSPGSGYLYPPLCYLGNDPLDPFGAAVPSATVGILLVSGGSYTPNGTVCTTDAVSVFCATGGSSFCCKYSL